MNFGTENFYLVLPASYPQIIHYSNLVLNGDTTTSVVINESMFMELKQYLNKKQYLVK